MYERYAEQGLEILAFPCNQFGDQEPKDAEGIRRFVNKFNVNFPMMQKIEVNGPGTDPIYQFLKSKAEGDIRWNFSTKFLVNRTSDHVYRFDNKLPYDLEGIIQELLAEGTDSSKPVADAASPPAEASDAPKPAEQKVE